MGYSERIRELEDLEEEAWNEYQEAEEYGPARRIFKAREEHSRIMSLITNLNIEHIKDSVYG